ILSIIPQHEPGSFWVENIGGYVLSVGDLPADLMAFIADRPKFVDHPAFKSALDRHMKKGGIGKWQELPATPRHESLLAAGESLCRSVGVDPIPRNKAHFTRDLDDKTLAVT